MPPGRPPRRGRGTSSGRGRGSGSGPGRGGRGGSNLSGDAAVEDDGGDAADSFQAAASAADAVATSAGATSSTATEAVQVGPPPLDARPGRGAGMLRGRGPGASSATASSGPMGRLRPKNVRRNEAERERIALAEFAKEQQRLSKDAQRARARGFDGRKTRGRGGPFSGGQGEFITRTVSSAGISFESPASAPKPARQAGKVTARGSGNSSLGAKASAAQKTSEVNGYASATSYRDDDSRVNTDLLNSFTREYYEHLSAQAPGGSKEQRKRAIMPMGLLREAPKESGATEPTRDGMGLSEAADPEAEDADQNQAESDDSDLYVDDPDKLHIDDVEMQNDTEVWQHGARQTRGSARIKKEDGATEGGVDITKIASARQSRTSISKQTKSSSLKQTRPSTSKEPKRKPSTRVTTKAKMQTFHDPEDAFIAADLEKMRRGLGRISVEGAGEEHSLDNKLFLFQFPPILPPLTRKATGSGVDPIKVEGNDDVVMTDHPPAARDARSVIEPTADGNVPIKIEDNENERPQESSTTMRNLIGEGGFIGQLNVRRSGKVELSWGGRTLEVVPGDELMSLTTAVITEQSDPRLVLPGGMDGRAYGMGRIAGKFVLAPAFGEEEDWVVDPEDLVVE